MFGFSGGLIWRHLVGKIIQIWIFFAQFTDVRIVFDMEGWSFFFPSSQAKTSVKALKYDDGPEFYLF